MTLSKASVLLTCLMLLMSFALVKAENCPKGSFYQPISKTCIKCEYAEDDTIHG
jgi:hypothetical protein